MKGTTEALCLKLCSARIIGYEDKIKVTRINAEEEDCCTELLVSSIEKAISEDAQMLEGCCKRVISR